MVTDTEEVIDVHLTKIIKHDTKAINREIKKDIQKHKCGKIKSYTYEVVAQVTIRYAEE